MKSLNIIFLMIFTSPFQSFSQFTLDCEGFADEESIYEPLLTSCTRISESFQQKYGNQEYWIPDPLNIEQTPIKTISINIHIMQKESPDPLNNFDLSIPSHVDYLNSLFEGTGGINDIYSYICEPSDPINCVCGSECHLTDTRIRFEIQGIYEHQDNDYYLGSLSGAYSSYGVNKETELNIFFMGYDNGIISGYVNVLPGYNLSSDIYMQTSDYYYQYLSDPSAWQKSVVNLSHELGHTLGLQHTYAHTPEWGCCPEDCNPLNPDYLDDVFGSGIGSCTIICTHHKDYGCDNYSEFNTCTNNMMGGTGSACYFSPEQIGRMQRNLHIKNVRKYVKACPTTIYELSITEDEEWDFDFRLYNEIVRISNGSVLTIKCNVYMPTNSKFIVEQGSSLVVEGGTISSACGELWQGIEVWGKGSSIPHPTIGSILSGTYPATIDDHGVVYLKEGATIEFARNGITTKKYDETIFPEDYWGGIVVAHGASFINCRRAVEFMQYDSGDPQIDDDNISEFYRCNFEVNDNYPCEEELFAHVSMWDVDGVLFVANTFSDTREEACKNQSKGIYSIDATYTIASVLCGGAIPCEEEYGSFSGFYRAIHVENTIYRPIDIVVSDITFTDNYRGILLSNVDNSLIMSNNFQIPDIAVPSNNAYGIYLEDCTGYHIENNSFSTSGSYDDSSPYNAGLYVVNNSNAQTEVYRNTFSNLEAGIRVQSNNSNLQIKCNTFNDIIEKHDIYVTNSGELGHQGKCLSETFSDCQRVEAPAGNKLLNSWTNNLCDIKIFDGHPELKYRHHTGADYAPTWYTTGPTTFVTPIECTYPDILGDCYACQSKLPVGGSGYRMSGDNHDVSAYAFYKEMLAIKLQFQELEDQLMAEYGDIYVEAEIDILSENDELSYLNSKFESLLDQCTNQYVLENKIDSAIAILSLEELDWAKRRIVEIYISMGNCEDAASALETAPTDGVENNDFKTIATVQINLMCNGFEWQNLTEKQKSSLTELAGKTSKSAVAAENVLHFTEGFDFVEVFDTEEYTPRISNIPISQSVQIYPNPATNELFINLETSELMDGYTLNIYTITGSQLYTASLSPNSLHTLDLANIQHGLLFVQVLRNNQLIFADKILHL